MRQSRPSTPVTSSNTEILAGVVVEGNTHRSVGLTAPEVVDPIRRSTSPVPSLIGLPTMTFSVTPSRSSISPWIAALSRWLTVTSNAARAGTESFEPEMPWRPIDSTSPRLVIMSATSIRCRTFTSSSPCSASVLFVSR